MKNLIISICEKRITDNTIECAKIVQPEYVYVDTWNQLKDDIGQLYFYSLVKYIDATFVVSGIPDVLTDDDVTMFNELGITYSFVYDNKPLSDTVKKLNKKRIIISPALSDLLDSLESLKDADAPIYCLSPAYGLKDSDGFYADLKKIADKSIAENKAGKAGPYSEIMFPILAAPILPEDTIVITSDGLFDGIHKSRILPRVNDYLLWKTYIDNSEDTLAAAILGYYAKHINKD